MTHRSRLALVPAAAALLLSCSGFAATAYAQGASDCQPAAAKINVEEAHTLGGLGHLAKTVATGGPGAVADLTLQGLFACHK